MKRNLSGFFFLLAVLFSFASCDDRTTVTPFDSAKQAADDDQLIQQYLKTDSITNAQKTNSGLYYAVKTAGNGAQIQPGNTVTVHYIGRFLNGQIFDSSYRNGSPFQFKVGAKQVIKGWDEGLALMKNGETALLYIPSALAYGQSGSGSIPANTVLKFEITVLNVSQ